MDSGGDVTQPGDRRRFTHISRRSLLTSAGVGAVLFGGGAAIEAFVYGHEGALARPYRPPHPYAGLSPGGTSSAARHLTQAQRLEQSTDPQLRLLARYAGDGVDLSRMVLSLAMPRSVSQARQFAASTSAQLMEWHVTGVEPTILLNPFGMSVAAFARGGYDAAFDAFFSTLRSLGVTRLGRVVPFPSGNRIPYEIGATDPAQFVAIVNRASGIIRRSYPDPADAAMSIQLSSPSYLTPSLGAASTDLAAFLPFVTGLKNGRSGVSSLIISALPLYPGARHFVDPAVITGIARAMHVSEIVVSSGTWGKLVNPDPAATTRPVYSAGDKQRRYWLDDGILRPARVIKQAGYSVSVNIITQNNLKTGEGASATWGYNNAAEARIFRAFTSRAAAYQVPVTVYNAPY
jgi:hypothetical protein